MALFTTKGHTLCKLNSDLFHFRSPVVTDLFADFLEVASTMLFRIQSSSLLLTANLSLNATSMRTEASQFLPPVSHPPTSTSGTLEIPPCCTGYLHTHILAFHGNPLALCRIHLVAAAGPILLSRLILLRTLPLQRSQEILPIRKVNREPSHPILVCYSDYDKHLFEHHMIGHGVMIRRGKESMGINR